MQCLIINITSVVIIASLAIQVCHNQNGKLSSSHYAIYTHAIIIIITRTVYAVDPDGISCQSVTG